MRALAYDVQRVSGPGVQAASFDQILEASDVISLHVPLTASTATLIGAAELARMKPNCLLINTARGGLVDEQALADALRAGRIGGAGFDVLSVEPPRSGNPLLDLRLPNFVLTPHIAWASTRAIQILTDQLIDNLESFIAGAPKVWSPEERSISAAFDLGGLSTGGFQRSLLGCASASEARSCLGSGVLLCVRATSLPLRLACRPVGQGRQQECAVALRVRERVAVLECAARRNQAPATPAGAALWPNRWAAMGRRHRVPLSRCGANAGTHRGRSCSIIGVCRISR